MRKQSLDAREILIDILAALMFLSKFPVSWEKISEDPPDFSRAFWAFPLIGLFLGSISGCVTLLFSFLGLSSFVSVTIGISIGMLITGALHEDGLADSFDGLIGGNTTEQKIEIMRDSKIGTYGCIALLLNILIKIGCLTSLAEQSLWLVFSGFIVSGALGRAMIVFLRSMSDPVSDKGLSSITERTEGAVLWSALGIAFLSAIIFAPFWVAIVGFILCIIFTYFIRAYVENKLGGITGDILGATEQLSELIFLLLFASIWGML